MDADPPPELRPPVRRAVERLLRDPRLPRPAAAAPAFDAYASLHREGSRGFLVEAAVFVCGEYGTELVSCGFDPHLEAAGRVRFDGTRPLRIDLNQRLDGRAETILATLAHEYAHVWKAKVGLGDTDPGLDEILTDCVAVAFGFGPLMRAAYFPMTLGQYLGADPAAFASGRFGRSQREQHERLGYLDAGELLWVEQILWTGRRGAPPRAAPPAPPDAPPTRTGGVPSPVPPSAPLTADPMTPPWCRAPRWWRYGWHRWVAARGWGLPEVAGSYRFEAEGGRLQVVVACPRCGQALRTPTRHPWGRIRCVCGQALRVRT